MIVSQIPMAIVANGLEPGKFEATGPSGGAVSFTGISVVANHSVITVTWDVSRAGSFAGSAIYVPELTSYARDKTHLVFWVQGEDGMRFEIGLMSADKRESKRIVQASSTGGQVTIPLPEFGLNGVDLGSLTKVIIAFDYNNGEQSRKGKMNIGEIGFGSLEPASR